MVAVLDVCELAFKFNAGPEEKEQSHVVEVKVEDGLDKIHCCVGWLCLIRL